MLIYTITNNNAITITINNTTTVTQKNQQSTITYNTELLSSNYKSTGDLCSSCPRYNDHHSELTIITTSGGRELVYTIIYGSYKTIDYKTQQIIIRATSFQKKIIDSNIQFLYYKRYIFKWTNKLNLEKIHPSVGNQLNHTVDIAIKSVITERKKE